MNKCATLKKFSKLKIPAIENDKIKLTIQWILLLSLALPAIVSSPLAVFYLQPLRSQFELMGYGEIIAISTGIWQLSGGLMLILSETHKLGRVLTFLLIGFILISKIISGMPGAIEEELIMLGLLVLLSYFGYPKTK